MDAEAMGLTPTSLAQLPKLPGLEIILTWEQDDQHIRVTRGDQLIWQEQLSGEAHERFEEIAIILQRKYDTRLKDLEPTPSSRRYLIGDRSDARECVEAARAQLALGVPRKYTYWALEGALSKEGSRPIRLYLLAGGDPGIANPNNGKTLLYYAAFRRRPEAVRLLAEAGAPVNRLTRMGQSALTVVLDEPTTGEPPRRVAESLEIVRILVEAGAALDGLGVPLSSLPADQAWYHYPPLVLAAQFGHLEVIRYLLERGAPVDMPRQSGMTAFHCAILYGQWEAAQILREAGADINVAYFPPGYAPLHLAVAPLYRAEEAATMVRLLVSSNAALEKAAEDGKTPLLAAVREGRPDLALLLLSLGANVHHRANDGNGVLEILQLSVQRGMLAPERQVFFEDTLRHALGKPVAAGTEPIPLPELASRFQELSFGRKKRLHQYLCAQALHAWCRFAAKAGSLTYVDTVVGMSHSFDLDLPAIAYHVVFGTGFHTTALPDAVAAIDYRYQEPIVALQDEDVTLPEESQMAYYAIYNAFQKYERGKSIDDWLIVNQALSAFPQEQDWPVLLGAAMRQA